MDWTQLYLSSSLPEDDKLALYLGDKIWPDDADLDLMCLVVLRSVRVLWERWWRGQVVEWKSRRTELVEIGGKWLKGGSLSSDDKKILRGIAAFHDLLEMEEDVGKEELELLVSIRRDMKRKLK